MKNYISTLQSQIARNSVEIKHKEFMVRIAKAQVCDAVEDYKQECERHSDSCFAGKYLANMVYQVKECENVYSLAKKTLKKLVENQKTLKKLKTQLVLLDNLYGEEDW